MVKDGIFNQTDSVLLPFFNSANETEIQNALAELLLTSIQPEIEKSLRHKMRVSLKKEDFNQNNQDALEIAGEVKLLIIARLEKLKSNHHEPPIQNLKSYVTSVTINAYQQYLRNKYPWRQQLKNKLRYLLTHHPEFALWETENGWLCGFKQTSDNLKPLDLEQLQKNLSGTVNQKDLGNESKTIDLVRIIFNLDQAPVYFNDLLVIVADLLGIKDQTDITLTDESILVNNPHLTENKILNKLEQQEFAARVWLEIQELPVRHRSALLLNLKDEQGNCLVHLLPVLRIASIRQIAEILEFEPEQFAVIWQELPWEDLRIAEHLNLTRQQIINLRQSARARLVRQIKKL
jgi:hypothetical protein